MLTSRIRDTDKPSSLINGDAIKGYYVEALGFFLITHEDSKYFGVSDTTVDSVTIER